jgi:sugar phosphate isomerase/epimerase
VAVQGPDRLTAANLALLSQAGLDRVEVSLARKHFPRGDDRFTEGVRAALGKTGVTCGSVHLDFEVDYDLSSVDEAVRAATFDDMKWSLTAGARLGAGIAVVHGSDEPVGDDERAERIRLFKNALAHLAPVARERKIRLALELLPRTCLANTVDEALQICGGLPAEDIGICLDVNHINLREDPAAAVKRLGPRILSFHISDNDGVDERHWFPFEGVIDWPSFMGAVRAIGYEGQFVFETGGSLGEDLPSYLREVRARFDRLMALQT